MRLFVATLALLAGAALLPACASSTLPEACALKPESGRCRAAIPRYWYDPGTGTCKAFIWGGCDGVVPFETYDACHQACTPGLAMPAEIPGKAQAVPAPADHAGSAP
jgi:hypothetical protein